MKMLLLILLAATGCSSLYATWLRRRLDVVMRILTEERTRQRKTAASSVGGAEELAPLMRGYPYDAVNFRYIGAPVAGVQFEEDRIVFVEFKARRATDDAQRKRVKRLVESGRVDWEEL